MSKVAVVYWSGTGNTEAMANAIVDGAKNAGAEVDMFTSADFNSSMVANYTGFAFGCPSMGAEELEDSEFAPMWDEVKNSLDSKKVVLFGSYGWGDGEWMRIWEEEAPCTIQNTFICTDAPDADAEDACNKLGAEIA